jgi:hypothetical protein
MKNNKNNNNNDDERENILQNFGYGYIACMAGIV